MILSLSPSSLLTSLLFSYLFFSSLFFSSLLFSFLSFPFSPVYWQICQKNILFLDTFLYFFLTSSIKKKSTFCYFSQHLTSSFFIFLNFFNYFFFDFIANYHYTQTIDIFSAARIKSHSSRRKNKNNLHKFF